jgi:hypothetical protein
MATPDLPNKDHDTKLLQAIGETIMAWGAVEFRLLLIFQNLFRPHEHYRADIIWATLRSFEAKIDLLSKCLEASAAHRHAAYTWSLLRSEVMSNYKLRNKIAHGTVFLEGTENSHIEPFLALFSPKPKIHLREIYSYREKFVELIDCLLYFDLSVTTPASQHQELPRPAPDLLRRLLSQDAQKREAQSRRDRAWRQYLKDHPELR